MIRSRAFRALCLTAALVLLPIVPAWACSCAGDYDPRDSLAQADGAIVGTYLERHPADPADPYGDTVYVFRVDEAIKGEFGETVDVHSGSTGASCGFEMAPGGQTGLFLRTFEGAYHAGLCDQITAERLREAAAPLPAPDGELPVRYVVGGSFGDQRVMTLDSAGGTIAYGEGDGDASLLGDCPGASRIAEIAYGYEQTTVLAVRELDTLEVVSEVVLPIGHGSENRRQSPVGLHCRDGDGGDIAVFSSYNGYGYGRSKGMLFRVRGDDVDRVHSGDGVRVSFHGGRAYIGDGLPGRDVISVELDDGRERSVGRAPAGELTALSASNDGRHVAGVSVTRDDDGNEASPRVWTMRTRDGELERRTLTTSSYASDLLWTPDDRKIVYVALYGRTFTFDRSLQRLGRSNFNAYDAVALDDSVVGVFYGALRRAGLPEGSQQRLTELPTPTTFSLLIPSG